MVIIEARLLILSSAGQTLTNIKFFCLTVAESLMFMCCQHHCSNKHDLKIFEVPVLNLDLKQFTLVKLITIYLGLMLLHALLHLCHYVQVKMFSLK